MGAKGMSVAVADAGPLIHLHEIDRLSLLQLFALLHIPDAVWQETRLEDLQAGDASSLFVTRAIVELAIEQLRQSLPEK